VLIRALSADRREQDSLCARQVNAVENTQVKSLIEARVDHHKVALRLLLRFANKGKTDHLHVCVVDVP